MALIGSLLTAVPLSPAGLGIVEAGVIGVLTVAYGVPLPEATAIALLDRVISVFSVIVFGSIAYVLSGKPRGEGWIPQPDRIERYAVAGRPPERSAVASLRGARNVDGPTPQSSGARSAGRTFVTGRARRATATDLRRPHRTRPQRSAALQRSTGTNG